MAGLRRATLVLLRCATKAEVPPSKNSHIIKEVARLERARRILDLFTALEVLKRS
jgi:hypothetical protein